MQPVKLKGSVSKKQKGLLGGFIQEDAKTIGKSLVDDIIRPTIKDLIFNGFKTALEMALWGESSGNYTSHGGVRKGNTNYNGMYTNRQSNIKKANPRSRGHVDILKFDEHMDADMVLESLSYHLEQYKCFSIADYYRACGYQYEYTDNNYGWYSMVGIQIVHLAGGGWTIDFPEAQPLTD